MTTQTPGPEVIPVRLRRIQKSMLMLGIANEIVAQVIIAIAGNDIANSLNGSPITTDTLNTLTSARVRRALDAKYAQFQHKTSF